MLLFILLKYLDDVMPTSCLAMTVFLHARSKLPWYLSPFHLKKNQYLIQFFSIFSNPLAHVFILTRRLVLQRFSVRYMIIGVLF
jgi:hypothetical protein